MHNPQTRFQLLEAGSAYRQPLNFVSAFSGESDMIEASIRCRNMILISYESLQKVALNAYCIVREFLLVKADSEQPISASQKADDRGRARS
jgi:hypothetical protein